MSQTAKFEWYHDYSSLKSLLLKFCSKPAPILHVGVGLSSLQVQFTSPTPQQHESSGSFPTDIGQRLYTVPLHCVLQSPVTAIVYIHWLRHSVRGRLLQRDEVAWRDAG